MSRINSLVSALCPTGVEFKALGDVGAIMRGRRFVKADIGKSGTPCIHYGELYTKYGTWTTEAHSYLDPALASNLRVAQPGDVIFVSTGETVEDIGKAVAWLGSEDVVIHDALYAFRSGLDPKYVAYFSQTRAFHAQIRRNISSSKVSAISPESLGKVRLPVPPLEVQREVVRVLDQFAALGAILDAELVARRRQYGHYRDTLMTLTGGKSPTVAFGDAANIVRGASPRPIDSFLTDAADGINWIKIGDVARGGKYITSTSERIKPEGAAKSRFVRPGDFVLSNSMSFGRPYILKIEGCIHDGWLAIKNFEQTFNPHFLYHLLSSSRVRRALEMKASSGTVQNLNADIVKSLLLPAPNLEDQARVAAILDKFDSMVNDLSIGLPAEIAARRKQYEYYRDRLLTFEEAA